MNTYYEEAAVASEEYEDPHCHGCLEPIEDGSVLQFGDGIWHFECFRCAKCKSLVECYSKLLLLRDGSPICEDCSYRCNACNETIRDEAIMTGEEAYHADCFRCVQCQTKIENLVFTQTSKGIFCTACHEMRRQLRQRRKEERQHHHRDSAKDGQSEDHMSPDETNLNHGHLSRNASLTSPQRTKERKRSVSRRPIEMVRDPSAISILNAYSDPANEDNKSILSSVEVAELNDMLNAALDLHGQDDTTGNSGDREANSHPTSDMVLTHNADQITSKDNRDQNNVSPNASDAEVREELQTTKTRLKEIEGKFNRIKAISRKALDEFHVVKEGYAQEVVARREAENLVKQLKNELAFYQQIKLFGGNEFVTNIKEEINALNKTKAQLAETCETLRIQRDDITKELDTLLQGRASSDSHSQMPWEKVPPPYQQQLVSIRKDVELEKSSYSKLIKARDDIINEMIMLNTKNAQLTSLNNDLSRRVMEREREAIAVMAGTSFLGTSAQDELGADRVARHRRTPSASHSAAASPEKKHAEIAHHTPKVAQRDSFNGAEAPRLFKFRRTKEAKAAKHAKDHEALIGLPYDSTEKGSDVSNEATVTKKEKSSFEEVFYNRANGNHHFTQTKFLRPQKCEACGEKMWRVSEYKCYECGIVCHIKCVYNAPPQCGRKTSSDSNKSEVDKLPSSTMFGNDLAKQVQSEKGTIPLIVQTCIEAVETRGMDYEGIYRKSGGAGQMRIIQQAFEQGNIPDLCDEQEFNDVCAITSILKQYFRDLPNPLFTHELHAKFMEATMMSDTTEQYHQFQRAIHSLPAENYDTLKYLMQHLDNVRQHSKDNLMTSKNIAVVFGPTLMRHEDEHLDILDMNRKIGAIEFIINHLLLFDKPAAPQVIQSNHSSPLPVRQNSLGISARKQHRREASSDQILRNGFAAPPRERAGYI
ncbi:uncharacterized protein BYT42DRAFT_564202 [Radiomyces spectabilis]|uniref:uncharacterized protein n=1 Tax=Radiomyces spectabilis TaxID=64574 RepID=UPI00221F9287|nr:uncharacterized protein BYT42DRAFT_564202 [Radiomyces spectabilis]KAI8384955.1 hypothetical protein BYT42DRAFT_564202 [Radiomyces spectabilis]